MAWTVETLNDVVHAELEEIPDDMRARFVYISQLMRSSDWSRSESRT
jgi:hypothetical protein